MRGPEILARSLSKRAVDDKYGNTWQYHSRSDRHSKIACWGILFDLLQTCRLLTAHAERGAVVFGINHEMRDFRMGRKKNLDLVLCTPRTAGPTSRRPLNFRSLVEKYAIELSDEDETILSNLPDLAEGAVGSVHLALEAKACMTAHVRAKPRLYDELNSSHLTIHGSSDIAIAAGLAMVNSSKRFISSDLNKIDLSRASANVSGHQQPRDTIDVIAKIHEIPRRGRTGEEGFDAVAVIVVDCANDGSKVRLVTEPPAPQPGDTFHYEQMIRRIAQLYEARFPRV